MIKKFIFHKRIATVGLAGFLFIGWISPVIADATEELKEDFENFGKYLGYTVTGAPSPMPSAQIDDSVITALQKSAIDLFLGTIPGKSIVDPDPNNLNSLINKLFKSQAAGAATLESSHLIDQKASKAATSGGGDTTDYPDDPVSQSIVNLLGTPAHSMCIAITSATNTKASDPSKINCSAADPVYQEAIALKVIGTLPKPTDAYSINTTLTNQLNSNTLISPFIYLTTGSSANSSASNGLPAGNQAQEAENFIRYASSAVSPPTQMSAEAFQTIYKNTTPKGSKKEDIAAALYATEALSSYFVNVRTYAAQISVGTGNLYHMLSKRMPQSTSGTTSSEAYNEYLMATKRLHNPVDKAANQQWVEQINNASPAAVQKEIAVLLSEINYQLYLSRQQEERLLLTNTAMLFQLSHLVIPPPPSAPSSGSGASGH